MQKVDEKLKEELRRNEVAELTQHHFNLMNYYRMVEEKQQQQYINQGKCKCGDTGYLLEHRHEHTEDFSRILEFAVTCTCNKARMIATKTEKAGIPEEFNGLTLNNFNLDLYENEDSKAIATDALRKASLYVRNYSNMRKRIQDTKGLYIYSCKRGSGKTRLAASVVNNLIKRENVDAIFITSIDLLASIRKCYDKDSDKCDSDVIDKYCTVNLLVIDDIGAEKSSKFVDETFFRILDTRMKFFRTTIFTSNIDRNSEKYEERISDRLRKMTVEIKMPEESVRSKIGRSEEESFFNKIGGAKDESQS